MKTVLSYLVGQRSEEEESDPCNNQGCYRVMSRCYALKCVADSSQKTLLLEPNDDAFPSFLSELRCQN